MKTNFKFKNQLIACAYVLLAVVFLIGCKDDNTNNTEDIVVEKKEKVGRIIYEYGWHTKVRVFEVDSCEYIGFESGSEGGTSIIHKQNCKFCLARNAK